MNYPLRKIGRGQITYRWEYVFPSLRHVASLLTDYGSQYLQHFGGYHYLHPRPITPSVIRDPDTSLESHHFLLPNGLSGIRPHCNPDINTGCVHEACYRCDMDGLEQIFDCYRLWRRYVTGRSAWDSQSIVEFVIAHKVHYYLRGIATDAENVRQGFWVETLTISGGELTGDTYLLTS